MVKRAILYHNKGGGGVQRVDLRPASVEFNPAPHTIYGLTITGFCFVDAECDSVCVRWE